MSCSDIVGATRYFEGRARQLLADGYRPASEVIEISEAGEAWGARGDVVAAGETLTSVYVYDTHRGRGHMRRFLAAHPGRIITTPDCDIEAALEALGARFVVAGRHTSAGEYRAIEAHYGDRRARRSKAFLMNHIDEGIALLRWAGAAEAAERAFCLHPIVQADDELARADLSALTVDPPIMALVFEYRSVANAYLSADGVREPDSIRLSPLAAVNAMLRADKIQNYADFLRFHRDTHPRAAILDGYFRAWLARLGVSDESFVALSARIRI